MTSWRRVEWAFPAMDRTESACGAGICGGRQPFGWKPMPADFQSLGAKI